MIVNICDVALKSIENQYFMQTFAMDEFLDDVKYAAKSSSKSKDFIFVVAILIVTISLVVFSQFLNL